MKKIIDLLKDSIIPILELILLIFAFIFPITCNVAGIFDCIFDNIMMNFDNLKYFFLMKIGNVGIGVVFTLILLCRIRMHNCKTEIFTGNHYHNYPYSWYWICSKLLGFQRCILIRVPIAIQFKLVINDTFASYNYGNEYPVLNDEKIMVDDSCNDTYTDEINLVLSDTYPISSELLPYNRNNLTTIYIKRNNTMDSNRYYSPEFVKAVMNTVNSLPVNVHSINLFPTLNPRHSYEIANNVFKKGGRGRIDTLTVFPQSYRNDSWKFERSGIIIFKA